MNNSIEGTGWNIGMRNKTIKKGIFHESVPEGVLFTRRKIANGK
jgi:hypothetical protein